jgi:uncharacterized protein
MGGCLAKLYYSTVKFYTRLKRVTIDPSNHGLRDGMTKLSSLGFSRRVNCEAIVSTINPDGSPNAAPMGMEMKDEQHLTLNIFNTSTTCRNLKAKKCAVINLTNSIDVYYRSTFKEANPNGRIPLSWFIKSEVVEAQRLRLADASVEVSVTKVTDGEERTLFSCKVEWVTAKEQLPKVYCRALPLTVEAITHATRVKAFISVPEKQKQVNQLIETIQNHAKIVERVAPNSEFTGVFDDLLKRIELWRNRS